MQHAAARPLKSSRRPPAGEPAAPPPVRHIVFAVAPDLVLLDASGPLEAFWRAELAFAGERFASQGTPAAYRTTVASIDGGVMQTFPGLPIVTQRLDSLDDDAIDTLIVPGIPISAGSTLQPALTAWIARRAPHARRVCSVCTGAFYLADAGLLDGLRATTHWRSAGLLAQRYPRVKVEADPIFIRESVDGGKSDKSGKGGKDNHGRAGRSVWTSAGVTAGIDLALALIEEDLGHTIAMQAARRLVVFMKRPGGQTQFSTALAAQTSGDGTFDRLHGWMAANLRHDLSVERLAERARMSPRTFARRYVEAVGRTPARTVSALRLEAASHALAESNRPLKRIALECGFGSEQNLRRAFVRGFGVLPLDYRERFASTQRA